MRSCLLSFSGLRSGLIHSRRNDDWNNATLSYATQRPAVHALEATAPSGIPAHSGNTAARVRNTKLGRVRCKMAVLIVVIVIVVLLALGLWAGYNGLVKKRNRTQEAWSQIDVELKRRHDLIPNLVETVKGYAAHERGTFEAVTKARAAAVSAGATGDPASIAPAENALSASLRSLFAVAENYPQLRAVESFTQLQEQLTATEDKLEFARRYYNTSARDYNIALQTFPRNLLAGTFGFHPVGFFGADAGDRAVPSVQFGDAAAPSGLPAAGAPQDGPPQPGSSGPPAG
jgi:LemA protein